MYITFIYTDIVIFFFMSRILTLNYFRGISVFIKVEQEEVEEEEEEEEEEAEEKVDIEKTLPSLVSDIEENEAQR